MRIRTQIILAAFVLAVVPLAAIVTYSYHSSRRALEAVSRSETDRLTRQMDRRLGNIRAEIEQRLAVVSALPLPDNAAGEDGSSIATVLGDAASFVDALEFQPIRNPRVPEPPDEDAEPEPAEPPEPAEVAEADAAAAEAAASLAPAPPPPPLPPTERMVIELPHMPAVTHFFMSEEHKELIQEIGKLGSSLGNSDLDPAEREDIRRELHAAQEELRRIVLEERKQHQAQLNAGLREDRRRRDQIDRARRDAVSRRAVIAGHPVAPVPAPAVAPAPAMTGKAKAKAKEKPAVVVRKVTKKEIEEAAKKARTTSLLLGSTFQAPVRSQGELVGQITARISPDEVIRRVLGGVTADGTEIPFAMDREGNVYTRSSEERKTLDGLGVPDRVRKGQSLKDISGWIVTTSTDPQSGLRVGVARPVGDTLEALRRTAARNFALGMGLIAFALIGIVPLSNHLTRDVKLVTEGAERIAQGDLMTRLPVKTTNELGQLAKAFNRMAEDLSMQQQRLVEQERARKEQELQQRLMTVEYDRKTFELEEARRFQLSMLPKHVPQHPAYDVAVYTRTATEVGGDYYDFHLAGDVLSVTIGDATGHGAKAGTMVTVVKTLFSGYGGTTPPAEFLHDAAEKIKRMDLGRMAMALSLARIERGRLTLSSAGMPPALLHRAAAKTVEEIELSATPLGTLGSSYEEKSVDLASGDTVLFLSDGFPELMNDAGQQLGYAAALDAFGEAAQRETAGEVIEALATFAARWHGDAPPNDDVTFVIVRLT
ncbi:MAG TPA: SpoIIE family protein phosphatase [Thermoanaerobaculia bacterium]|jgi:serine phosphatase RsbU (regulator of sigma subunit)